MRLMRRALKVIDYVLLTPTGVARMVRLAIIAAPATALFVLIGHPA